MAYALLVQAEEKGLYPRRVICTVDFDAGNGRTSMDAILQG